MKIGTSRPRRARAAQLGDEQAGAQQDSRAELLHSTCRARPQSWQAEQHGTTGECWF